MEEVLKLFAEVGVPTWVLAALFVVYAIVKEMHLFEGRGHKSERELLSADELTFRQGLMDRIKAQGLEIEVLHKELATCHFQHAKLSMQLDEAIYALRSAGLQFLTKMSPSDPMMETTAGTPK